MHRLIATLQQINTSLNRIARPLEKKMQNESLADAAAAMKVMKKSRKRIRNSGVGARALDILPKKKAAPKRKSKKSKLLVSDDDNEGSKSPFALSVCNHGFVIIDFVPETQDDNEEEDEEGDDGSDKNEEDDEEESD